MMSLSKVADHRTKNDSAWNLGSWRLGLVLDIVNLESVIDLPVELLDSLNDFDSRVGHVDINKQQGNRLRDLSSFAVSEL